MVVDDNRTKDPEYRRHDHRQYPETSLKPEHRTQGSNNIVSSGGPESGLHEVAPDTMREQINKPERLGREYLSVDSAHNAARRGGELAILGAPGPAPGAVR